MSIHSQATIDTVRKAVKGNGRYLVVFVGVLLCGLLLFLFHGTNKKKATPPLVVAVASVKRADVPLYHNTIGTVTPVGSAVIKTQINGYLTKVHFQEGASVRKGDLLAQIDPLPYEAALEQSEGALMRDKALLKNARTDLQRYEMLGKQDSVSKQVLDTQRALVKQYEGLVKIDEGLVKSAKVNVRYCRIVSEIDGVVGLRTVNPGNFVQTSDVTPITTITTLSPMGVVFPVSADHLPAILEKIRADQKINVDIFDKNGTVLLESGVLAAVDSQISVTTGTVDLKAVFQNTKVTLYPNQFVNVRLTLETLKKALTLPSAAVQMGNKGSFVYVVNPKDKSVEAKQIKVLTILGEDTAVSGHITQGQLVITQGQDKVTQGSIVSPKARK